MRLAVMAVLILSLAGCAAGDASPSAPPSVSGSTPVPSAAPDTQGAAALVQAGIDLVDQGRSDEAIDLFTKAIELDPDLAAAYYGRGVAYGEAEVDLSLADLNTAIELDPTVARVFYNRGIAYFTKGMLDLALADYTKAIELDPTDAPFFFNRGFLYEGQGKVDLAIADYTKAIEVDPLFDRPVAGRAYLYQGQGKLDLAIADYTRLTRLIEPGADDAPVFYNRGVAYGDQGRFDLALADFTTAIDLDPAYADAFYARGMAREVGGDHAGATSDLDRALALASDPELVTAIKAYKCAQDLGCVP